MKYVLVLLYIGSTSYGGSSTITNVPKYDSLKACTEAGLKAKADLDSYPKMPEYYYFNLKFSCIPGPTD